MKKLNSDLEEGSRLARRLRVAEYDGDVFLDLERSDFFSSYSRPVNEPMTISIYKPHEKKCKLLLVLSLEEVTLMHSKIDDAHVQVLLRIGQYVDGKILWDKVPEGVTVKISRSISLGKVQSPMDVARYVGHWPSSRPLPLEVYWSPSRLRRSFHIRVDLLVVRNPQAFPRHLASRLLAPEHALRKLREKNKCYGDSGVKVVNQEISLLCPFTLRRIRQPAASSACEHLQCFDGETYFRMNLENPKWTCPFCRLLIYPNDMIVDGFFLNILKSSQTDAVILSSDGTWKPVQDDKEKADDNRRIITLYLC